MLTLFISGGHIWYSLSSKSRFVAENQIKLLKYGSWATSAGFADWYAVQAISPSFNRDYSNMAIFLIFKVSFFLRENQHFQDNVLIPADFDHC